jgi:hypothetical protein
MNRALFYSTRVIALLLTVLGCGGTSPVTPEGCLQNVQVAVLAGTNPAFSWSPGCGVSSLSVATVPSTPGASEESMWAFSVPEQSPVGPPIRYGTAPVGATGWTEPRALVAGVTYRVRVRQTVGGDGLLGGGERVFTR